MNRFYITVLLFVPMLNFAEYQFPIGERGVYSINWGLLKCGTSVFSCDQVEWQGKPMIRVRVTAKSNWLVSTIYPVDDSVDCYIDPETGYSVRVEKNTSEGDTICRDNLILDRDSHTAFWTSESDNINTNYPIAPGACDAISFLYEFRKHTFEQEESRAFNLVVDAVMHQISITAGKQESRKVPGFGKVSCRRYTVSSERDDLFVRKIPLELWLTEEGRKVLVRMDLKVPVGKARIILEEYTPPDSRKN